MNGDYLSASLLLLLLPMIVLGYDRIVKRHCVAEFTDNRTCSATEERHDCLGITLGYHSTVGGALTIANRTLADWRSLSGYPDCWKYLAPLLCSMYRPKCENSTYERPSKAACRKVRRRCAFVFDTHPDWLDCDASPRDSAPSPRYSAPSVVRFVDDCLNTRLHLDVVNVTCVSPLIHTVEEHSFYSGVSGCGLSCASPAHNDREHASAHVAIAAMCFVGVLSSGFAVATFALSWRRAARYPQAIVFYANVCLLIASLGWSVQFLPGARTDIVCRRDRTPRLLEPRIGDGESATCALVFVIVYYAGMAAVAWFAVLAFAWRMSFASLRTQPSNRRLLKRYVGYFHMFAWSLPLVLTIACLASSAVEGDSLTGVCSVSAEWRPLYVVLPVGSLVIAAFAMIASGLATLLRLRNSSGRLMSPVARRKVGETVARVSTFAGLAAVCFVAWLTAHYRRRRDLLPWDATLKEYVLCRITESLLPGGSSGGCKLRARPDFLWSLVTVVSFFCAALLMSSFAWNRDTVTVWRRFLKKRASACFASDRSNESRHNMLKSIDKHRIIAEAFKKRAAMHLDGQISLSFATGYDIEDPIGLRMVGNREDHYISGHSSAGIDVSDSWMAAIPRLVQRRGAICMQRRYSDSDFGESVRSSLRRWSSAASDSLFGGLAASLTTSQKRISDRSSTSRERVLVKLARIHTATQSSDHTGRRRSGSQQRVSPSSVEGSSCDHTTLGGTDTAWSITSGDEQTSKPLLRSSSRSRSKRRNRRLVTSSHRWLTENRRHSNEEEKKPDRSKRPKRRKRIPKDNSAKVDLNAPSEELAYQSLVKHARVSDWLTNEANRRISASSPTMTTSNSSFKDISSLSSSDVRSIDTIDLNELTTTVIKRDATLIKYNNFLPDTKESLAVKVKSKIKSSINSTKSFINDSHDKVKHIYIDPNDS